MGREQVLAAGRAFLPASLADACVIEHPTGASTRNPTTGEVVKTYVTVYTGPCKVSDATPSGTEVAEAHRATLTPKVTVPSDVVGVVEGDRVTITASASDPDLVGRQLRVQGPMHETWGTARRLQCIEASS